MAKHNPSRGFRQGQRKLPPETSSTGSKLERAFALHQRGNLAKAETSYREILEQEPRHHVALNLLGVAAAQRQEYSEAVRLIGDALAIKPDYVEALYNRGKAFQGLNRYEEALASYEGALAIKPNYAEALNNRGTALEKLNRYEEALTSYGRALTFKPDYAEAHWNESVCRLLVGDFQPGWEKYEWRWQSEVLKKEKRDFAEPLWLGEEDLSGKTILLHAEQGLGDTIQFCRYAPMVSARGARVVLEVQPALETLLSGLDGVVNVVPRGAPLPTFDLHCPLLSLPMAFKTELENVPAQVPYVCVDAELVETWRLRLGGVEAPRIGLVWSGSPKHKNDHNRSIALQRLVPIFELGGNVVGLQKDVRVEDREFLAECRSIENLGDELHDFADTAALVSLLDVVVSVDTSVAHLAGALGKPTWIMLPFIGVDWRWMLDRDDSPWYATARLFRQPAMGDWDSVVRKLCAELSGSR